MTRHNILYAQSGGVTAVINATAAGVLACAREHDDRIGVVFGARNGILGALREDLVDTSTWTDQDIQRLAQTPGGTFGSCRFKLKSIDQDETHYRRLIEVMAAHDIRYFFYNGGGDSADTAHKISHIGDRMGFELQCIGIPKTIDNDLALTDTCPGFGSTAKFVTVSMLEASLDVLAMAESSTKVFILEVMGRHAGWIAAATAMCRQTDADPPHVILLPERDFSQPRFLAKVAHSVSTHGYCTVVVSEGVRDENERFLSDTGRRDAFGHAQLGGAAPVIAALINERLKLKCHWAVPDYLQRSARHLASAVDYQQATAVGRAAVDLALEGKNAVMPIIERLADEPYRWQITSVPLAEVANRERKMPDEFISEDGFGITELAQRYFRPLIRGEAYPEYANGVPTYFRPNFAKVEKRLSAYKV